MAATDRILYYFADPMCSWCWGFSPVIDAIKAQFENNSKIALVLGGLRPGTTEPVTAAFREEILHHWREVMRMTGQAFRFENALPEGFVYDTEPPSRAVVTMGELQPDAVFPFFKSLQQAFYAQGLDVTQFETLAEVAANYLADMDQFKTLFQSSEITKKTHAHFQMTREFGVRGFPTLILQDKSRYQLVTHGYRDFESLQPELKMLLAA